MRCLILIFFVTIPVMGVKAQSGKHRFTWEAGVSAEYKIFGSWSGNTSIGKRSVWSTRYDNDEPQFQGNLDFLEFSHFTSYEVDLSLKVAGGYTYRLGDPHEHNKDYEHRMTEQVSYTHFKRIVRLISRGRLEQRFRNEGFAHRYRYKLSADFPLSGLALDAREFYIVVSGEALFEGVENADDTWEIRSAAGMGYYISNKVKIEADFTYRLEDINRTLKDYIFIDTSLSLTLD